MKIAKFLLFFLITTQAGAKVDIYEAAKNMGRLSTDELIGWASDHFNDDEDLSRFFYYWTAMHVEYDQAGLSGKASYNVLNPDLPDEVMKTRRAVCAGFAGLYKYLLSRSNVECVTVNGISKTRDNILRDIPYREDHSWNAVRVNGKWSLIDVTWANTTSRDGVIDDFYFMTDPDIFILDHFPMDERWQLIPEPVSLEEFKAFPCYSKKYFQLGFGGYMGDAVSAHRNGSYSIRIGVSKEWQPVLVAVNSNDREIEEPDFKITKGAFDYYQAVTFSTRKKIIRLDAVRQENNYIMMELGIVYFDFSQ